MAFEMFDRAKEVGYNKFTDVALNFRNLIQFIITKTSYDTIVYFYIIQKLQKREK